MIMSEKNNIDSHESHEVEALSHMRKTSSKTRNSDANKDVSLDLNMEHDGVVYGDIDTAPKNNTSDDQETDSEKQVVVVGDTEQTEKPLSGMSNIESEGNTINDHNVDGQEKIIIAETENNKIKVQEADNYKLKDDTTQDRDIDDQNQVITINNPEHNQNDVEDVSSTASGTNTVNEKHEQDNAENTKIKNESVARFFGNGRIKVIWIFLGLIIVVVMLIALKWIFSGGSSEVKKPSDGIGDNLKTEQVLPTTNAKSDGTYDEKTASYLKKQQEENAEKALESSGSYSAPIIHVNGEGTNDNQMTGNAVSFADASKPKAVFYDKNGKVYTRDEAQKLASQNINIEGVTTGINSINDPSSSGSANFQPSAKGNPLNGAKVDTQQKQNYQPYVVQPLGSTVGQSGSKIDTEQSERLDQNSKDIDEWKTNYIKNIEARKKEVDERVNDAYKNQLNSLIDTVKMKDNKGGFSSTNFPKSSKIQTATPKVTSSLDNNQKQVLARAGETYLAISTTTLNTDEGNEVVARILSGPFKDATIVGTAKTTENNVQFVFTKILRKNKAALTANLSARKLGTNSLGMASVVKNHYVQRYLALGVSSALSGVSEAYKQTSGAGSIVTSSGTVITESTDPSGKRILGNAAGELGSQLSSDIKDLQKRKATYITNSGTVFTLFLNDDVSESNGHK